MNRRSFMMTAAAAALAPGAKAEPPDALTKAVRNYRLSPEDIYFEAQREYWNLQDDPTKAWMLDENFWKDQARGYVDILQQKLGWENCVINADINGEPFKVYPLIRGPQYDPDPFPREMLREFIETENDLQFECAWGGEYMTDQPPAEPTLNLCQYGGLGPKDY